MLSMQRKMLACYLTKPYEYFLATSSLKHNLALDVGNALLEDKKAYMGKLLETYVASRLLNLDNQNNTSYKTYYDDSKKKSSNKNVDFIVQRGNDKPIPIEVSCGKKDKTQIRRAMNKYQSTHGVIISNTTTNVVKKDDIIYLPPEIFGFM
jgi:predicted AAA+ superfamily ATPase